MNELQMQALTIQAVIAYGGQAMKMQNEFVRGVADLMIKLPGQPAFMLEAKRKDLSPTAYAKPSQTWQWDVSHLQKNFLRSWHQAGMWCGILSFAQLAGGDVRTLRMAVYSYPACINEDWTASLNLHEALGDSSERNSRIYGILWQSQAGR